MHSVHALKILNELQKMLITEKKYQMYTPPSRYSRCKYIKYYRNLYMACVWLGKLHAFSRYNSNFQCDTTTKKKQPKWNENCFHSICDLLYKNNNEWEKYDRKENNIKKKLRTKKQWKSSNINSLGTNDILSTIETWLWILYKSLGCITAASRT